MILLKVVWILIWTVSDTEENAEALSKSETLLSTIKTSWTSLGQKLNELEFTPGPWTSGTHPFNHFKYKVVTRPLAFAAATKNCERMSGNLLYGDIDLAKFIPDLREEGDKVWYSTKDTRPLSAMKNEDVQNFINNIGTCYTVTKTAPPVTVTAREEGCEQKHVSICIKMVESHRELYTYETDIQHMKNFVPQIRAEDVALTNTLQRLLLMGQPATDLHHPAGLGQTIQLLTSIDHELSNFYTNIPLFPEKDRLLEELYKIRNSALTTSLMVMAQHLENYINKIDTLVASSHQHLKLEEEERQSSGLTDDSTDTEANQKFQIALELRTAQDDITAIKQQLEQIGTQATSYQDHMEKAENLREKLESVTSIAHNNRRRIKTSKDYINNLNTRLNQWIQEKSEQILTPPEEKEKEEENQEDQYQDIEDANNTLPENLESRNVTLPFKLPKAILDFLQNEEYIWIATSITILFTIIAVTNSIVTCIYVLTSNRRNKAIKKHLRWGPKERRDYRREQDVEMTVPLNTSRLEDVESQIQTHKKRIYNLEEQVKMLKTQMETVRKSTRTGRQRKRNAPNAPAVPPRK